MINYNKFSTKIKGLSIKFTKKYSNSLKLPVVKTVNDFIFGITKSNSSLLSEIARALNENIKVKDTVDRLAKGLIKIWEHRKVLIKNYYDSISDRINDNTCFHVDNSDVNKDSSRKLECLDRVKDGSAKDNRTVNGYTVTEIVATNSTNDLPISLYSKIFSKISKGFKSINIETLKGINRIVKYFGTVGTYVMDRGYDSTGLFKIFIKKKLKFIIRGKRNRKVIYNNKKINIIELSKKFKDKYNIKLFMKSKTYNASFTYTKIKIEGLEIDGVEKELYAVFVYYGKETTIFYTNREINNKHDALKIISSYYMRWRIEEYFKFKKQQFDFENYRVRTLDKMNALNMMLTFAITCISGISNYQDIKEKLFIVAKVIKENVKFEYYRISDGIYNILSHHCVGVRQLIKREKPPKYRQLALFKWV